MRPPVIVLIIVGVVIGCSSPSATTPKDHIVTIVDIGNCDRLELGRMIRTVKKHSPRVVGLDFFVVPDSADNESILVKELYEVKNVVMIAGLHNSTGGDDYNDFDSLELSHPKFGVDLYGFGGLTSEDSVVQLEHPMIQLCKGQDVFSFAFVVAATAGDVRYRFLRHTYDEFDFDLEFGNHYNLIREQDLRSGNFSKDAIEGKIVLFGYMKDDADFFYLSNAKRKKIQGVEIHAAIINELIDRGAD